VKWLPFVACYFIPRGWGFFFLFFLSFSSLDASFFGCFQPCWFFQMPLPSFCFVGALYVALFFFTWVYFLLELFFFKSYINLEGREAKPPAPTLHTVPPRNSCDVVHYAHAQGFWELKPEGGEPYVAYGLDSVRTPYDTRTKHHKTPYDTVRHRTAP
jgi:hypothetical protein